MRPAGIITDNRFFAHEITSAPTIEHSRRLRGLYLEVDHPRYAPHVRHYPPRLAGMNEILRVHSEFYIDQIREFCCQDDPYIYDKDTYLMEDSLYTAQLAAGAGLVLLDAIMAGEIDSGFSLVRPPGHHASIGRGMGFCILNNVAVAAQYLLDKYRMDRISILDFDGHHANGTQEIFYNSSRVLLISIHQRSIFPYTGSVSEFGEDMGLGYNINLPVYAQFGDLEYMYLIGKIVQEILEQYVPQFILVSAGYDGHVNDSVTDICLSTRWFAAVTKMFKFFAREFCQNRLLYILEGGYEVEALEQSVLATLNELITPAGDRPAVSYSSRAERLITNELYPVFKEKWII